MKKYLSFLFISFFFLPAVKAQITVQPQLPAGAVAPKSALWNMVVVSTGGSTERAVIEVSLLNADNNNMLFTAKSIPMLISKGAKIIKAADAGPIQYNYFAVMDHTAELIPPGNYEVMYTVEGPDIPVSKFSYKFIVEPLSPPLLQWPANGSKLEEAHPLFTWLPPTPVSGFKNLNYQFRLVEVASNQNPEDAIQKNPPVYTGTYSASNLQHPASAKALDTGRLYAWQIIAQNGFSPVAASEVWSFTIGHENYLQKEEGKQYLVIKEPAQAPFTTVGEEGIIRFNYFNPGQKSKVTIEVFEGAVFRDAVVLTMEYGENYVNLPLRKIKGLHTGKQYRLTISESGMVKQLYFNWIK